LQGQCAAKEAAAKAANAEARRLFGSENDEFERAFRLKTG